MHDKAEVVQRIAALLSIGDTGAASLAARQDYPWVRPTRSSRRYGPRQATRVFVRDGFLDRYSGQRLVYPGALLLLSRLLPEEFPAHPNWKLDESHFVFWELWPTIDHVVPVTRDGVDAEDNWVTTSMVRNAAKGHWTLEELGWQLRPPGSMEQWDGLLGWFVAEAKRHPDQITGKNISSWLSAATASVAA